MTNSPAFAILGRIFSPMAKPLVIIAFGGVSAEHEVSVVTGLQALEKVDTARYTPYAVYINKNGEALAYPKLRNRKGFSSQKPVGVSFGRDAQGAYVKEEGMFGTKRYPRAMYMAFHGGTGESGPMQGLCEAIGLPYTSSGIEGATVTMNKALGKEVLNAYGLPVVEGVTVRAQDLDTAKASIQKTLTLPVIIKPAHLGSSIGISIAKTEDELERHLMSALQMDSEVVVERLLSGFKEYNCSVRLVNGKLEASEVESPVAKDEILSFADKYQRGGGKKSSGMASLNRELPAHITTELRERIQSTAKHAFVALRCKGMVRIDFMYTASDDALYITEVNPIPGSMAFYLWEASGIPFTQQITDLVEQAVVDMETSKRQRLDYRSDIIEKFIAQS